MKYFVDVGLDYHSHRRIFTHYSSIFSGSADADEKFAVIGGNPPFSSLPRDLVF